MLGAPHADIASFMFGSQKNIGKNMFFRIRRLVFLELAIVRPHWPRPHRLIKRALTKLWESSETRQKISRFQIHCRCATCRHRFRSVRWAKKALQNRIFSTLAMRVPPLFCFKMQKGHRTLRSQICMCLSQTQRVATFLLWVSHALDSLPLSDTPWTCSRSLTPLRRQRWRDYYYSTTTVLLKEDTFNSLD